MTKRLILIIGITLATALATLSQANTAMALGFDPGYIISDSVFINSTSMNADSIQQFIRSKGASCTDGAAPCLKNFTENGKSAGTIIAEAAQNNSINPQVLLATLQKETGLVTMNGPGLWRYRTAMGYGCPDTAACDTQYYGFTNQMNRAASMFRRIMIYDSTWYSPYQVGQNFIHYSPDFSCGGGVVNIQNRATAALYDYTPYQPNMAALNAGYGSGDGCSAYGNRNFWLYFNDWFGSSVSSILIQSPQSAAVYLQSGNTRFGIPTWDVIDAYGFGRFGVTAVSDSYMNSLIDGGVLSTVFSNKAYPGPIYLADNGHRFGFASYQQCIDWGFPSCNDSRYAKALEPSVFDRLSVYGDLSPLMLNGGHIHLMRNGEKLTFLSGQAKAENGFGAVPTTPMTNRFNTSQPYGNSLPENNSFITFRDNPAIYAYNGGKFFPLTYNAFKGLQSKTTPLFVDTFSRYVINAPVPAQTIGSYIGFSDQSAYALTDDKKINITGVRADWPMVQIIDDIRTISDRRLDDVAVDKNSTYRTNAGTILKIENKSWRGFYNITDYFSLGYNNPTPIGSHVLQDLTSGNPIFAPGYGSLFQVQTPTQSSGIFTTSSDNTICQIYSLPQLGLYKFNTNGVHRISELASPKVNLLSTNVYDQWGNVHIVYSDVHSYIPPSSLVAVWGIKTPMNICTLTDVFLSRNKVNLDAPRFVRNEHTGIIYYGEGGFKRPIYSWSAFIRMGGNSTNTLNVSMEFLVSSPDGVPIYQ